MTIKQNLSQGRIAAYQPYSFLDGEGIRASVYLSGCLFNCLGCYNKSAQDFSYGNTLTDEKINKILNDIEVDYCDGLSLLGGDPFFNIETAMRIIKPFRTRFSDKKSIWVWSGFKYEELLMHENAKEMLQEIDILVDGKFIQEKFIPNLAFRGSTNQRIIDVKHSTKQHIEVLQYDA